MIATLSHTTWVVEPLVVARNHHYCIITTSLSPELWSSSPSLHNISTASLLHQYHGDMKDYHYDTLREDLDIIMEFHGIQKFIVGGQKTKTRSSPHH
jgi:hypothetical protein